MQKNWRELIKPKRLEIESTEPNTYGKFECEPLERGFGITLGNALRGVLLSSLQGVAITNVKIDGVLHEFSTIPGVLEDVTDVILNLKEVRFKMSGDANLRRVDIEKSGEGRVTAGDILAGPMVEVLNPNQQISYLAKDAKLRMGMTIRQGKGYFPLITISRKLSRLEPSPALTLSFRAPAKR